MEAGTLADLPAVRLPWYTRISRAIAYVTSPQIDTFVAGAEFSPDHPVTTGYPTESSMAALSAFPWVRACVLAKAEDMAALPFHVEDRAGEEVPNHRLTSLLNDPATRTTGRWLRMQMVVDYELSGNAYALVTDRRNPSTTSLLRLHPRKVDARVGKDGQISGYGYDSAKVYAWEDVAHIRQAAWQDGPEEVLGEGAIRSLHASLSADLAAKHQNAKAAKRGRFEFLITPKSPDMPWSQAEATKIRESYTQLAETGGGALVIGNGAEVTPLTMTPKDMEYSAQADRTRDEILAVFAVPPSRVGLPTANYATQRQQMKTYWEALKSGPIAAFADAFGWLAEELGSPGDRLVFDLDGVDALQESMGERLARVTQHILHGIPAADAYRLEGLDMAAGMVPVASPIVDAPAPRAARAIKDREAARLTAERVRAEEERKIARATAVYLQGQLQRTSDRLAQELGTRSMTRALTDAQMSAIIDAADELARLASAVQGSFGFSVARAFARAAKLSGVPDLVFDPSLNPTVTIVQEFAATLTANTEEAVRQIIATGVSEGQSVAEMQAALQQSAAFAPSRALRVGRTESTRTLGAGAEASYQAAANAGIRLQKEWLSARDSEVRDSHAAMDGQVVDIGAQFTDPTTGDQAGQPGGFGVASQDIGCRCTTIPVVENT